MIDMGDMQLVDDDQIETGQAVNPDEPIYITPLGVGILAMENAHRTMRSLESIQGPLLHVVRHALIFYSTWRRCFPTCRCQRCELYLAVRDLVHTMNDRGGDRS